MGKRGPARKPTHLRVLEGSASKSAAAQAAAVQSRPVAPHDLEADAVRVWDRLIEITPPALLTALDEHLMTVFCEAWALREKARKRLKRDGLMVYGSAGQLTAHPAVKIIQAQNEMLVRLGGKMGMTPADRASLEMPGGADPAASAFANLIGRGV